MRQIYDDRGLRRLIPTVSEGGPIIVALPDDRVGDVFAQIEAHAQDQVRVIMSHASRRAFIIATFQRDESTAAPEDEPCPISVDSEYGMLMDLMEMNGGSLNLEAILPGVGFALVGTASS